jgi:hypothetical protein
MSATKGWLDRMDNYHYSQDDRVLGFKFKQELIRKFDEFDADVKQNSIVIGEYNIAKEPWRALAIMELARERSHKVISKPKEPESPIYVYTVIKQKLSKQRLR